MATADSYKMSNYKPAQIYAAINTDPPPQKVDKVPKEKYTIPTKNNEIQVSATAELSLVPDRCKLSLVISNKKDQAQEVKNSVQRRLDYVLQTLNNHEIKESDIHVTKVLQRLDGLYHMEAEIVAHFIDFNKCQTVSNFLVEKLDESVKVSMPDFYHSAQRPENFRRQASLTAVRNAKQKAAEIAQFLHAKVGRPVAVREEYCNEWEGPPEEATESDTAIHVQNRINQATLHVRAKVAATFELKIKSKSRELKE